jgi:hypothetical protein
MDTVIIKGGKFTTTLDSRELSRGLRKSARAVRNAMFLTECDGAVGQDGVLSSIEQLTSLSLGSGVVDQIFPFPQVFDFTNLTIVCDSRRIYEYEGGTLTLKYTSSNSGGVWCAVDFFDYVYISNGVEAVTRDAGSKEYTLSTVLPTAQAMCNYNGQVLIGSYDTPRLPMEFWYSTAVPTVTVSIPPPYLSYMLGYLVTEDEQYYITAEDGTKLVVEKGITCG